MRDIWLSLTLTTVLLAVGCSSSDDDGNDLFGMQNDGPGNACVTNVEGCNPAAFSCNTAQFCYDTGQECAQSNECSTGPTTGPVTGPGGPTTGPITGPGTGSSCTTNVSGCQPAAFSCDTAAFCYDTLNGCEQSNECPI